MIHVSYHDSVSFSFANEKDDIDLHRIILTHGSNALSVPFDKQVVK